MTDRHCSEDWLAVLEWAFSIILNPSPGAILESFESWNYRHRLKPALTQLRKRGMLENLDRNGSRRFRLTDQGRLAVNGGSDPAAAWTRPWDGRWRMLLFDLPAREYSLRLALWRWLKERRFGYLQRSVWISPDDVNLADFAWPKLKTSPESLTIMEAMPGPADTHQDIVHSAWDFAVVNRRYQDAIEVINAGPQCVRDGQPAVIRAWLARERVAWMTAVRNDPLLPEALLPTDYLGRKASEIRRTVLSNLARNAIRKL